MPSLAPTFRRLLQDQVSEAMWSPSAVPPAPAPLSYAKVASWPPLSTFSPTPFAAPPRPIPPDQQLAWGPVIHLTIAHYATSAASLVMWHGFVTVSYAFKVMTNLCAPTLPSFVLLATK